MAQAKLIIMIVLHIALCVATFIAQLLVKWYCKPFVRGFFCDDETIRKPYKSDTVKTYQYWLVGVVVTLVCVPVTEYLHYRFVSTYPLTVPYGLPTGRVNFHPVLLKCFWILSMWFFGIGLNEFITNFGKCHAGRLRPHFLSVCNPDFASINCTVPGTSVGNYIVGDQVCRWTKEESFWKESRLSFPSGHASGSAYLAAFVILYFEMEFRLGSPFHRVPKLVVEAAAFVLAYYVALSRVADNKHHPTDVIAGAVIGTLVALVVTLVMLRLPSRVTTDNPGETDRLVKANSTSMEALR